MASLRGEPVQSWADMHWPPVTALTWHNASKAGCTAVAAQRTRDSLHSDHFASSGRDVRGLGPSDQQLHARGRRAQVSSCYKAANVHGATPRAPARKLDCSCWVMLLTSQCRALFR